MHQRTPGIWTSSSLAAVGVMLITASAFAQCKTTVLLGFQPPKESYKGGEPVTFIATLRNASSGQPIAGKCLLFTRHNTRGDRKLGQAYTDSCGRAFCPSAVPASSGGAAYIQARWPGDDEAGPALSILRKIAFE